MAHNSDTQNLEDLG
ncbi:unnamed protein product, partial [Allacma fusca]